jgi:hypothetical protein
LWGEEECAGKGENDVMAVRGKGWKSEEALTLRREEEQVVACGS